MASQGSAGGGAAASSGVAVTITTAPMTETEDDMAVAEEEEVAAASAETEEHVQRILLAIDAFTLSRALYTTPYVPSPIFSSSYCKGLQDQNPESPKKRNRIRSLEALTCSIRPFAAQCDGGGGGGASR